ncbi:hypothetical protein KL86DES1_10433 [uncultured Desulfovibrio sp.]|uniref:Transposase n=1 Tax=uncultured Desulfovibrio sp. TaxID=167968 RepID=A0A212KYU4_9BACT|nr:hypothetical protein KL86DES1_10433 [uncultured Desulfovibrio sp.]VZH32307.1 conserved protein of unknown function [Desulfovibrio sp. 86]
MKPAANREAVHYIRIGHGYSERRACQAIQFNRCSARRPPSEDRDLLLRARMLELAEDRRRFGSPRLHEPLRVKGWYRTTSGQKRFIRKKTFHYVPANA